MRAGDIDATFAPKVAADVCDVEIDGEIVVFSERMRQLHLLNSTAGVVWRSFDGSVSLAELAHDVADAFGEETESVEVSLVEVARSVGALGLLEGIEAEEQTDA
jgi:hypothetical protein